MGLAAAAHLLERGLEPLVLEAGPTPAPRSAGWATSGCSPLGSTTLTPPPAACSRPPDGGCGRQLGATRRSALGHGAELIEAYLTPLAGLPALSRPVRYGHRVTAVARVAGPATRLGSTRPTASAARPRPSWSALTRRRRAGIPGRAVIDASGTWSPQPARPSGLPALGEAAARWLDCPTSPLPDPLGATGSASPAAPCSCSVPGIRRQHADRRWAGLGSGTRTPRSSGASAGARDPARSTAAAALDQLPPAASSGSRCAGWWRRGHRTDEHLAVAALEPVPEGEPP